MSIQYKKFVIVDGKYSTLKFREANIFILRISDDSIWAVGLPTTRNLDIIQFFSVPDAKISNLELSKEYSIFGGRTYFDHVVMW